MTTIRIKPASRPRKPVAERTCCETHRDRCNFGRPHVWMIGYYADGVWVGDDSMKCGVCDAICTAGVE